MDNCGQREGRGNCGHMAGRVIGVIVVWVIVDKWNGRRNYVQREASIIGLTIL